jgi:hypothetical protein
MEEKLKAKEKVYDYMEDQVEYSDEKPDLECPGSNWDTWIDTLYCN